MDVKETQEGTMKKVEQFQMNDGSMLLSDGSVGTSLPIRLISHLPLLLPGQPTQKTNKWKIQSNQSQCNQSQCKCS